jgi:hypothetical protein
MANRTITFPESLKKQISKQAGRNFRTFNSHVLYLIQLGLEAERKTAEAEKDSVRG